jgi:3-dehydroquinate synthetase
LAHGEAVAIGMALAARLSVRLGRLDAEDAARIERHLATAGLPTRLAQVPGAPFDAARLVDHMRHDKKTADGNLTFILLDAIGRASVARGVDPALVASVLAEG